MFVAPAAARAMLPMTCSRGMSAQAVQFSRFGAPSAVLSAVPVQQAAKLEANQVRVQMLAAPVHPADLNVISGTYGSKSALPGTAGLEGVGKVVEVGAAVRTHKLDDWVVPTAASFGTWRTEGVADAADLLAVSRDIGAESAATAYINPGTALLLLSDFVKLNKGDVLIQNGGNSSVGRAVTQLAAAAGVHVVSVVRNRPDWAETVEALKKCGAAAVVNEGYVGTADYRRLTGGLPAPRLALNCVGGPSVAAMARELAAGGTLVTYGAMSRTGVQVPASALIFKDISLRGFWFAAWAQRASAAERQALLDRAVAAIKAGKLVLPVERFRFSDWAAAVARAAEPLRGGRKVVLTM